MSWYYITAGLVLYALDSAIRLLNTVGTVVQLEDMTAVVKDGSRNFSSHTATPPASQHGDSRTGPVRATVNTSLLAGSVSATLGVDVTGVTKLAYTIKAHGKEGSRTMSHLMGQYVYINVPAISSLEWHPFTISSSPVDTVTTNHIKVMGGLHSNQWTAKLHLLALDMQNRDRATEMVSMGDGGLLNPIRNQNQRESRGSGSETDSAGQISPQSPGSPQSPHQQSQSQQQSQLSQRQQSLASLHVNIDGPYGLSVVHELHKYSHVLLVGGGIGVTPLHSCLRHLVLMKMFSLSEGCESSEGGRGLQKEPPLPFPFPALESVKLLWSVRSTAEASLFADTVSYQSNYAVV